MSAYAEPQTAEFAAEAIRLYGDTAPARSRNWLLRRSDASHWWRSRVYHGPHIVDRSGAILNGMSQNALRERATAPQRPFAEGDLRQPLGLLACCYIQMTGRPYWRNCSSRVTMVKFLRECLGNQHAVEGVRVVLRE